MFCIAAFIVFAILGIFSVSYRKLAGKAWYCVIKRITFKPCDINFSEEVKGKILGKLVITRPKLAKFLDKSFDWIAFVFVVLSVWSLLSVMSSGLNLWVYDTCNPVSAESCSLSGEACGVGKVQLSLTDAVKEGRIGEWVWTPFKDFGETVSRIPDRLKTWEAKDYLTPSATFYYPKDETKGYAVEALDPSCVYCKKLFNNVKKAGFEKKYNFSYIAYPIPDHTTENGYKFKNSFLIASYLEAIKMVPLSKNASTKDIQKEGASTPDWQMLEKIFTGLNEEGIEWQIAFTMMLTPEQADQTLQGFLSELGYSKEEVEKISQLTRSEAIKKIIAGNKELVENKLKTVKIPTIVFDGRRYDRVIDAETLK